MYNFLRLKGRKAGYEASIRADVISNPFKGTYLSLYADGPIDSVSRIASLFNSHKISIKFFYE
jgi:hypothetical protein